MQRDIEHLKRHVIVCGYGRMGHMLAAALQERHEPYVIVDIDPARVDEASNAGLLAITGDATEESTLLAAGIERAKSVVTTLPSDAANVYIVLTSRNLNRNLLIISRGESPSTQKKLVQAGADRVVVPAAIGAQRIAVLLTTPTTLEFLELVAGPSQLDVEVGEVVIAADSPLVGTTVEQAEARRQHGLLIVAVKRAAGEMVFNPDADFPFAGGDTVIFMGKSGDIARFRAQYKL